MKIALTGHRIERLATLGKETDLVDWIKNKVIDNHCTDAYCGMASGADILFGKTIIELKQSGHDIKLHCILPCRDYNISHPDYNFLKNNADTFKYLSREFYKGCDNARDQKMVDECDILLALFDGMKAGGVWHTILKAKKSNKKVIMFDK